MKEMLHNSYQRTFNFNMRLLIVILVFIAFSSTEAQAIVIQGQVEGFNGKTLKVLAIRNYLTNQKETLAQTIIEENKFKVEIELSRTQQLFVKVEDKVSSFFAESGEVYNLALSYDPNKNQGKAYNKILDLKMAFPKPQELNQKIKSFNRAYQAFFSEHYEKFVVNAAQDAINQFITKMSKEAKYQTPKFMADYATYALANLEDINRVSDKTLFEKYLKGRAVLHHHKEYMNFFTQFYQEDFGQFCITKRGAELLKAIMFEQDLKKSLELVQAEKGFEQKELAELYLINGLFEVYHKKVVDPKSNLAMLAQLKEKASSTANRNTATAVIEHLEAFGKNKNAPSFSLYNSQDKLVKLNDFEGKYIYLGFWANWSIPSLKDLKIIQKLEEKYGDKVQFVSINLDEDKSFYKKTKIENRYPWPFLHYGNDYELREKYEVKSVPSYYLIDPDGKMLKPFAPGPAEVEKTLYQISQKP